MALFSFFFVALDPRWLAQQDDSISWIILDAWLSDYGRISAYFEIVAPCKFFAHFGIGVEHQHRQSESTQLECCVTLILVLSDT